MQDHPSLVALPAAYEVLFPELASLELPDEPRSTCHDCVQVPPPGQEPDLLKPFDRDVKCCTYRPALPNFLVGRALSRGNVGSDKVAARIRRFREGVRPEGLFPPSHFRSIYRDGTFGRDKRLTCPYWVPGDLSCSIWEDRNAVCRTWFCKMSDGPRSGMYWKTVRDLLTALERRLSRHLVEGATPPEVDATPEQWMDWYIDCHERLQATPLDDLREVTLEEREGLEVALRVYGELLDAPVPDVIFPVITATVPLEDRILVHGYSRLETVEVPRTFMALFGELVQGTPWRTALERVRERAGLDFDDAFVETLWRRGIVTWPLDAEQPPELQAWLDLCQREGLPVPGAEVEGVAPELSEG